MGRSGRWRSCWVLPRQRSEATCTTPSGSESRHRPRGRSRKSCSHTGSGYVPSRCGRSSQDCVRSCGCSRRGGPEREGRADDFFGLRRGMPLHGRLLPPVSASAALLAHFKHVAAVFHHDASELVPQEAAIRRVSRVGLTDRRLLISLIRIWIHSCTVQLIPRRRPGAAVRRAELPPVVGCA